MRADLYVLYTAPRKRISLTTSTSVTSFLAKTTVQQPPGAEPETSPRWLAQS